MSGSTPKRAKAATKAGARKAAGSTTSRKASAPKRPTKAERERLRALLPTTDPRYSELWDRGAGTAHTARTAAPLRVSIRSAHRKRLAAIEAQSGLDRQAILNRAIATGWEALQMTGKSLDDAAARLRRQSSAAGGTVTLHPTAATLRVLRQAKHPNAKAILLQTGLNAWAAA